jgi:hypothetical protein
MLVQPVTALPGHAAAAVARVEQDAEAARVVGLARRFTALVAPRLASSPMSDIPTPAALSRLGSPRRGPAAPR